MIKTLNISKSSLLIIDSLFIVVLDRNIFDILLSGNKNISYCTARLICIFTHFSIHTAGKLLVSQSTFLCLIRFRDFNFLQAGLPYLKTILTLIRDLCYFSFSFVSFHFHVSGKKS